MKKIILLLLLSVSALNAQTKVSGVVTYYFNEYQGNKPDIGANVIFIDSSAVKDFNYKLYEDYTFGSLYQEIYFRAQSRFEVYSESLKRTENKKRFEKENSDLKIKIEDSKKELEYSLNQLKKYNYDTMEKSSKVSGDLFIQLIRLSDNLPKKTVDALGNYSINLKPGVYYVFIKSKNRKSSSSVVENDGKIFIKKITIKENEEKDVSVNFEI